MTTHQILLLTIAHEAIEESLTGAKPFTYTLIDRNPPVEFLEANGVFVTITKQPSQTLRGCIGIIGKGQNPLYKNVYEMAKAAAFQDHRFHPLHADELDHITLSVSILSEQKELSNLEDIRLGIDGVIFEYEGHHALFLPEVAIEQNWTRGRMLSQLCLKAGLPPTFYQEGKGVFHTFTTMHFSGAAGG